MPEAVFPARTRRTPTTAFQQEGHFSGRFLAALQRAKIDRRTVNPLQRLRHTFASELLTNGVPIFKLSKWLGHSSIQLTIDTYGHLVLRPDVHEAWTRSTVRGRCHVLPQKCLSAPRRAREESAKLLILLLRARSSAG